MQSALMTPQLRKATRRRVPLALGSVVALIVLAVVILLDTTAPWQSLAILATVLITGRLVMDLQFERRWRMAVSLAERADPPGSDP